MSTPPDPCTNLKCKVLRKANPNRHGWVKLLGYVNSANEVEVYFVITPDDEDGYEIHDFDAATTEYERVINYLAQLPNWEAQDEYDSVWGQPLPDPPAY